MGAGGILILIGVIVVLGIVGFLLASNAGWLGARGSDPERQGVPGTDPARDPEERPRHTKVGLEQNTQDEPRGEPVDRVT